MSCFGKNISEIVAGPQKRREFSLNSIYGPEFGIHDLDLLETIGTGTFSRVRLCRHVGENKFYAIKIMKKSKLVQTQQVEHVKQEVYILAHIQTLFTIELKGFFQDDNNLFLVTEFANGGELFSHLRKRERFDEATAKFFSVEIACGLQAIHEYGVVYRGLKPENIVLDKRGHIKLIDFGFAKDINETKQSFTLCGTPEYLAPEILQGSGYGQSSDWWGFGVLLFEMIAGYPPFFSSNPFAVYQLILKNKITFPSVFKRQTKSAVVSFLQSRRSSRLGCSMGGFRALEGHAFFKGISWDSARLLQIQPVIVPTVGSDGDTSNFDFYPEEFLESSSNLTVSERDQFKIFEEMLNRSSRL